jgi:hypothetical protein
LHRGTLTNAAIKYGAGRHFLLLTLGEITQYLALFYALNINLNVAMITIKLSLLFQFLRLFDRKGWPWRASVVGIVLVTLWGLAFMALSVVPCARIPDAWNVLGAREARCWGYASQDANEFVATLISHNAINTFFDLFIIAIPLHIYTQPKVPLKTRLGLMVLLLMGAT